MTRFTPLLLALATACRSDAPPDATDTTEVTDDATESDAPTEPDSDTDLPQNTYDLSNPATVQRLLYAGVLYDLMSRHRMGLPLDGACSTPTEVVRDDEVVRTWTGPCEDAAGSFRGSATQTRPVDSTTTSERWVVDDLEATSVAGPIYLARVDGRASLDVYATSADGYADTFLAEDLHVYIESSNAAAYGQLWPDGVHVIRFLKEHPATVHPIVHHIIEWELQFPDGARATFDVQLDETRDGCGPGKTSVNEGVGTLTVNDHTLVLDFTSDEACTGCYAATLDGEALVDPMCVFVR